MIFSKRPISYLILAASLLFLVNCGGGGGNDSGNGGNNNPPPDDINANLTGKLYIGSEEDGPWIMDFSTGHYTSIPGVLWKNNSTYHNNADFSAYPASDGLEFIETIGQCESLGGLDYQDCIILHDSQGGIVSQLNIPYETHGPARFSRDRQFFAVPIQDPGSSLNPRQLTLFARDGSLVDASDEDVGERGFDWLPDNSLIYVSGQTLYRTQPGSAQGVALVTFPASGGVPDQLAMSPDGTQLAFTLKTAANFVAIHGTTWVLNLDGSRLVQLTNSPGVNDPSTTTDDPIINFPTWSPDGRWIAVVEGSVAAISPTGSTQGDLYAVPSDGENVMLTLDESTSAIPVQSYFEETFDHDVATPELSTRFNVSRGGLSWLQ